MIAGPIDIPPVFFCGDRCVAERHVSGIFQADREGFSNEDRYHILWQFSDSTAGNWWMGVLKDGSWVHFEMDLGNPQQWESFFAGELPAGVVRA
jgi:hypothetical protein